MKRREFIKLSATGVATLYLSSHIPGLGVTDALAANPQLNVTITDALKNMVTHNTVNSAQCYFWIYQMSFNGVPIPPECPGPTLVAVNGDRIDITITNDLDEPHSFFIPGRLPTDPPLFDSGPIGPGQTFNRTFTATQSGAFLYYDNLNEPVNRVMGLHGALIIRPSAAAPGNKFTPYDAANVTPHVQNLFNDFGGTAHWPGLAWEQGVGVDPGPGVNPFTANSDYVPPFRQYVWLTHQASPNLFAEVGNLAPGVLYDPQKFMDAFLRDPFSPTKANRVPQYFTINGQSGFFGHFSPGVTPMGRVGEPCVVHILNAGLWTHSMHMHANHFFITSINGTVNDNPIWVDVYTVKPMDRIDYTIPYMRPPDTGNVRGIGYPDTPLTTINGRPCWPPVEEFALELPPKGAVFVPPAVPPTDINGNVVDLGQLMSPLCYPMHDHSEPSQTAQGGNYNCGLISGAYFLGDRNTPGHLNFPMDPDFAMMYRNTRGVSGSGGSVTEPAGPPPNGYALLP